MKESLKLYISNKQIENLGQYNSSKLNANISTLIYNGLSQEGQTIKNIINNQKDKILQEYSIIKGELKYIGEDTQKVNWFASIEYGTSDIEVATQESTDNTIQISNTKEGYLEDYKIYGQSVQEGTPTPTNPIEVKSVGDLVTNSSDVNYKKYKIPVTVSGKNLIKTNQYFEKSKVENGITYTVNEDGSLTVKGTATGGPVSFYFLRNVHIPLEAGKTYTKKGINVQLNGIANNNMNDTYIASEGDYISVVWIWYPVGTVIDTTIYPQIEKSPIATAYEQYREPTTTNIYLDEPLRKVEDVADYIDYANQRIVRNIQKLILDGTKMKFRASADNKYWNLPSYTANRIAKLLSSNSFSKKVFSFNSNYDFVFTTPAKMNSYFSTVEDLNSYILKQYNDGIPVIVYYQLGTPEYEYINLPKIPTFEGTTNITVNTQISPSNLLLKYTKMTK